MPCKGWAEMIRKVYEVDPLRCPRCGGRMKVIAFLTEYAVVDRIREHLKLSEEYIDFLDINLIGATISYRF